jgi:hypothetical protein
LRPGRAGDGPSPSLTAIEANAAKRGFDQAAAEAVSPYERLDALDGIIQRHTVVAIGIKGPNGLFLRRKEGNRNLGRIFRWSPVGLKHAGRHIPCYRQADRGQQQGGGAKQPVNARES